MIGLVAALVLTGCAWWQPPSARDSMLPPYDVTAPFHKDGVGQLVLSHEGMWAFVHGSDTQGFAKLHRGELVGFIPQKHKESAHLFAVVLVRSWGALLQRLDARAVASRKASGQIVPLTNDAQLHRWGLCRGKGGHVLQNACLQHGEPTIAWHLFRADANARLRVSAQDTWGLTPPVHTDGLVHAGRAVLDADKLKAGWLAVPVRAAHPRVNHARVAVQTSCPAVDVSESLQPLQIIHADFAMPSDPIVTEEVAIELGADVLVGCEQGKTAVAVPVLYRPLLMAGKGTAYGVPFGAMRALPVAAKNPAARRAVILLGAALGTGSTVAADFYLERAMEAAPQADASVELARGLMQVFAAAGRPEQGLRAGRVAARNAWHVDNEPAFVLGRGWVYAALGKPGDYDDSKSRLSDLGSLPDHQDVRLWLAWNALRDSAAGRSSRDGNGALDYFRQQKLQDWLEATKLLDGDKLEPGYERLGNVSKPDKTACSGDKDCQLDVYGRNFAAMLRTVHSADDAARIVDQLTTTAVAAVRPGFDLAALDAPKMPAASAVAVEAALLPLLQPAARLHAFDRLMGAAAEAVRSDGRCVNIPGAPQIDARLTAAIRGDDMPVLSATQWLIARALPAACKSPQRFADSLQKAMGANQALAQRVAPLLAAVDARAPKADRLKLLRRFAEFTAKHELGAACERWNLALAVSNARAQRLDAAAAKLSLAINCQTREHSQYAQSRALLNAFLRFEKTEHVPTDIPDAVRRRLRALVRQRPAAGDEASACFGLAPMNYDLAAYVHPDIAALAVAMDAPAPDSLALETSSRLADQGKASMVVARRLLAEGRAPQAAKALLEARKVFTRVGHQVGLRRVRFLEEVVFEGDLAKFAAFAADSDAKKSRRARTSPTRVSLDKPARLNAKQWAQALRQGRAERVLAVLAAHPKLATPAAVRARVAAWLLSGQSAAAATPGASGEHRVPPTRYAAGNPNLGSLCKAVDTSP